MYICRTIFVALTVYIFKVATTKFSYIAKFARKSADADWLQ